MSKPENTAPVRADILTRFQPGNPGKPKGARNKLQEDFLKDILAAWEKSGSEAIDAMIADKLSCAGKQQYTHVANTAHIYLLSTLYKSI